MVYIGYNNMTVIRGILWMECDDRDVLYAVNGLTWYFSTACLLRIQRFCRRSRGGKLWVILLQDYSGQGRACSPNDCTSEMVFWLWSWVLKGYESFGAYCLCFEYTNVKTAPCNTEEHFVVIRHREALYGKIAATVSKSQKQRCFSVHVPSTWSRKIELLR